MFTVTLFNNNFIAINFVATYLRYDIIKCLLSYIDQVSKNVLYN